LEIINPRDGFVYLTSFSQTNLYEIPVEVIGGESEILYVTFNGNTFTTGRPFVFFLPRITGVNVLQVRNGHEEKTVIFTVL
jgi:hypothetical protein